MKKVRKILLSLDSKLPFDYICGLRADFRVGLLASGPNFELTRFQYPFSIFIGKRHLRSSQGELDDLPLARRQANTHEALQLEQRAGEVRHGGVGNDNQRRNGVARQAQPKPGGE